MTLESQAEPILHTKESRVTSYSSEYPHPHFVLARSSTIAMAKAAGFATMLFREGFLRQAADRQTAV